MSDDGENRPLLPEKSSKTNEELVDDQSAQKQSYCDSQRLRLYISYGLSSWGDRMWNFANSLALVCIGGNLQLAAISGLVSGAFVLFCGSFVGRLIDRSPRLKAGIFSLTANNIFVALSAAFYLSILYFRDYVDNVKGLHTTLLVLGILSMALGALAQTASNIVISKDWVVVICGRDRDLLAATNAMLLRIDLSAMIISPLIAGQMIASLGMTAGCLLVSCWHVGSYLLEMALLWSLHRSVPELGIQKKQPEVAQPEHWFRSNVQAWHTYLTLDILPAGLALALLYLTVLGLDGITTGFVYRQGIRENVVALVRGVGALFGIFGSVAYPLMRRRLGQERTGLFSLTAELGALSLCVISVWLPGSPFDPVGYFGGDYVPQNTSNVTGNPSGECQSETTYGSTGSIVSVWVFLAGVALARFGLWASDLTIAQIYQEQVLEADRGKVNGVQASLNKLMDLIKNIVVIGIPDDQTFGILIVISFSAVLSGFISFAVYSRRVRGHIMPFHKKFRWDKLKVYD